MKKILLTGLVICVCILSGTAQKLGHINIGNIIADMPEAAKADSTLILYQKQESSKGDTLAKIFQKEYQVFVEAYNAGTLSPSQAQKRQEELRKNQAIIQNYAEEVRQKVEVLRKQLLQPILNQLDDIIRNIGKEGKYDIIFDASSGVFLFAQDSEDVAPLVRKKLGLKEK